MLPSRQQNRREQGSVNRGPVNRENQGKVGKPCGFRCGTVAIVGRPNVGKSTLINALVGHKISITARKVQTTRYQITGIRTLTDAQYIFIDTPGFQTRYGGAFNCSLNRVVKATLSAVDVVMFVVEAGHFNADDQKVLELITHCTYPTHATALLLIANKLDRISDKTKLPPFLQYIANLGDFSAIIPLSAKRADDMRQLLCLLKPYLPKRAPLYDHTALTDRSERFLAAELLREKVFRFTGDELPYTSTVVIEKFEQTGRLRRIFATILVDRDSHKAIIIGVHGKKLKQISVDARLDMEKCFGGTVYLEIWVKVSKGRVQKALLNES